MKVGKESTMCFLGKEKYEVHIFVKGKHYFCPNVE